jgi:hypothetical protein
LPIEDPVGVPKRLKTMEEVDAEIAETRREADEIFKWLEGFPERWKAANTSARASE